MIIVLAKSMTNLPEGSYINDGDVSRMSINDFIERAFSVIKIYVDKELNRKSNPLSRGLIKDLKVAGKYIPVDLPELRVLFTECDYEDIIVFICSEDRVTQYRKENKQVKLW